MHENRFVKVGADGRQLPADAADWVAVRDNSTALLWTRANVSPKRLNRADAAKACAELELAGSKGWRLPTRAELLTLVDDTRFGPAIDTAYFDCEASWYWTSTPYAPSPGDCAWGVSFSHGNADWGNRDNGFFVRAVRPSQ